MDDLNKKLESIKNIKMTDAEKKSVLKAVFDAPILSPYAPKVGMSSWAFHFSRFSVAALALILVVATGGLSYAAERSLPGDPLYPLKVNVTEPLRDIVNITPQAKAEWEETKAVRRLDEAQALVQVNKFSPEAAADLETRFSEHAKAFSSALNTLSTSSPESASELNANFKAKVKIHSQKIEKKYSNPKIQVGEKSEANIQAQFQDNSNNNNENNSERNLRANTEGNIQINNNVDNKNSNDIEDQNKKGDNVSDFVNHIEQEID